MQSPVGCEDSACSNLGTGGVIASLGNNTGGANGNTGGNTTEGNIGGNLGDNTGSHTGDEAGDAGDNTDSTDMDGDPIDGSDPSVGNDAPLTCGGGASNATTDTGTSAPTASNTLASNASTFTSVGNPIDIGTGNKFQRENDYTSQRFEGLAFARYYNSALASRDVGLGYGWRHAYQRALVIDELAKTATVWRDDGAHFSYRLEDDKATAPLGIVDQLAREHTGWLLIAANGDREHYSATGQLQRIEKISGTTETVHYDNNQHVQRIENSRGEQLTLRWQNGLLRALILPDWRELHYGYDGSRHLATVREYEYWYDHIKVLFTAPERAYHYDDNRFPHALTGLDNATGARYATWTYDKAGRAISSEHGEGAEKVSVAYRKRTDKQREVVVTNAAGLAATYILEPVRPGKFRLRDVEGSAMFECPAVQNHQRYDSNGFLQRQWNADRIGNVFTRNARGLVEIEERGMRFDNDENPRPETGSTRLEREWLTDHAWVGREARFSWVVDKNDKNNRGHWRAVTRRELTYDEQGRVKEDVLIDLTEHELPYQTKGRRRERHYIYDFADSTRAQIRTMTMADGNRNQTTYRYENNQLRSIENSLHHTIHFDDYNHRGLAQKVVLPNGQTLRVTYNRQQLPIKLARKSANNEEIMQAEYDAAGRLIHLTRPDGSEQFYRYNSAGQLTQIKNNWGEVRDLKPNVLNGRWEEQRIYAKDGDLSGRQQRRFNALGQLNVVFGHAGEKTEIAYSAQGDVITASERDQDPAHAYLAHTTQARYDTQHHLLELIDAAGYSTHYDYSPSGQIEAITDAGQGRPNVAGAGSAGATANNTTTEYIRNGFGEIIEQRSPTIGRVIKRYDAHGNLIANEHAGGVIQFEYDELNRLTKVDYPGDQDDIHYTYDQTDESHGNGVQQLTHIETQNQSIDYRYDDIGRKIAETTREKNKDGHFETTATLQYHYLPGNRLDQIIYPDGSAVHYRFDKDRIVEVAYSDAKDTEKTIAKNIDYAPFGGPVSWTYGNGLKQAKHIDLGGN